MASFYLENELTDVLPGQPLPSEAANFISSRLAWIQEGEEGVFDLEAPLSWNRDDLCTLAFLISNHETSSARLLVANLLKPPSTLLPSASLPDQDFNYLKSHPFRRSRKSRRGKVANT